MRKILITLLITTVLVACDDRLEELNRPTKQAVEATGETLFANGLNDLFYMMNNSNTNINVFRLYAQYWAQTTYPDESQYNMVTRRNPDNFWRGGYRDALKDLDEARKATLREAPLVAMPDEVRDNRLAIIDACMVYVYQTLVDAFGAIPYKESLNPDIVQPEYENGEEVYNQLIDRLDAAINMMDPEADSWPAIQDFVYGGDVAAWMKFANSVKLKLAINIADVDAAKAETMVLQAITPNGDGYGGVILSNDENAAIPYLGAFPNTNPIHEDLVQSGRHDWVIANTVVDKLLALDDPRLEVFGEPTSGGTYVGGTYGTNNTYSSVSHLGEVFHDPTLEGLILDASEVHFMLAEAVERGFAVPGTAEDHYNAGIRSSMEYWGIDDAAIDDYLANPDIAYSTAEGGADWKQKIGVQHWIALFNRGFEGWTVWRRLDFTGFNAPPMLTYEDIPERFIFPIEEATLNGPNLAKAIQLIGGSDSAQTHVFWDVN